MTDRFELESQITMCSMIIEDIKDLTEEVIEGEPTRDQISNVLMGLEALYDIRFRKLDRILEQLIRTHQLLSAPREELDAQEAEHRAFLSALEKYDAVPAAVFETGELPPAKVLKKKSKQATKSKTTKKVRK